jgi:hypothetical protein
VSEKNHRLVLDPVIEVKAVMLDAVDQDSFEFIGIFRVHQLARPGKMFII